LPLAGLALLALLLLPASAGAYVYWNTNGGGSIGRADNDGSGANQTFIAGAEGAAPLAVDSGHLYYTTDQESQMGGGNEVARTDLDGGEAALLPEGFLGQGGEGIGAVDGEHIYWLDSSGIGRAKLDGSDREPEFLNSAGGPEAGGIAIYSGFVYWTNYEGGFGDEIGRANLSSKVVEPQYIVFEVPEALGPRAIAVDAAGIFWTMEPAFDSTFAGNIAHAGFGGTATLDEIPGVSADAASGLAIEGSDLYWFDFEEGFGTSLAHAVIAGSGSSVNRHLVNHVGNGWLAVNSAGPSAPPGPPPPPGPGAGPGPSPTPAPAPLKTLPVPKLKLNAKAGTATLTLTVPGPGQVVLSGTGIKHLHKTAKAAGPVALLVQPTKATAKKLKRGGSDKVSAKVTFTPSAGDPSSRVVKVTLKLN
jgi:hypothetical protein